MISAYIECGCSSPEHIVRLSTDDDGELYIEFQLYNHNNFFKRIWVAIKYIFGHKYRYGYWDCCIVDEISFREIREMLSYAEETKKLIELCEKNDPQG